jgi:hypothetical protein
MNSKPLDRRRKYYFVLDCETATLPYAGKFEGEQRKAIAISKPLIYDLGWKVIDAKGKVYRRKSYLITEIFSVPSIFNTAYYASKRPIYLDKLRKKEITLVSWETATADMIKDMQGTEAVGAYNSMFDFKKAIAFTEEYISHLYSDDYQEWETQQNRICDFIVNTPNRENTKEKIDPSSFTFRDESYPLFDIWGLSCENLVNNDEYRKFCKDNEKTTASGRYYPTSAETVYSYLTQNAQFVESHTAVEDADIECEILAKIFEKVKPKDMTMGIIYFPFRMLGRADTE